jgi:hypothetical protein
LVAQECRIAQSAQSGKSSLFWTHPACQIEFNLPIQVIADFFVELRVQAVAMKQHA